MALSAEIIAGFVGSVLAKDFDEAVASPAFHYELWEYACCPAKFLALAAPRGHAKSTAGTISYTLASALFREAKFIVIISDTQDQSINFLGQIKQHLQDNENIAELFGLKKNQEGEVVFLKDTEADIVVEMNDGHMFRIVAKGAEQKLRGMLWNNTRPDLVVIDDLENDELVMNKERREKLRRWFYGAVIPMLSRQGKLRWWGTVLHMDALLERHMPSPSSRWTVDSGLKVYETRQFGGWVKVKYRAHTPDFDKILWPERFNEKFFKDKKEDYALQGMPDLYSQEYLNDPIDESIAFFKKADLLPIKEEDKDKNLRYYITADLAISKEARADYTVFIVGAMDENRILHVKEIIRQKLDGKEIVDMIIQLERIYKPEVFGVEEMQVSKAIGPFLREECVKENVFPSFVMLKHGGKDKEARARSIQARMRAKAVKFDKSAEWYAEFEDEILKFPRGKHDDQVDALAYLGMLLDKMIEAPTDEEIEQEEYDEELYESRRYADGRSRTTGY